MELECWDPKFIEVNDVLTIPKDEAPYDQVPLIPCGTWYAIEEECEGDNVAYV